MLINYILNYIKHFHYMTCMAMPLHKNPCPGGHEIYNFSRPFLVIISLPDPCPRVGKIFFLKKYTNFTLFIAKLSPFGVKGHKITFFFFLPYTCYITNLVKIGKVVLEKKMLMEDTRQTTGTNP